MGGFQFFTIPLTLSLTVLVYTADMERMSGSLGCQVGPLTPIAQQHHAAPLR